MEQFCLVREIVNRFLDRNGVILGWGDEICEQVLGCLMLFFDFKQIIRHTHGDDSNNT